MTAGAVKFIRELAEKKKVKEQGAGRRSKGHSSISGGKEKFIEQMVDARNKTVPAEDAKDEGAAGVHEVLHLDPDQDAYYGLPDYCSLRHRFLVTIVKPQVALHSEAEEDSTVILTAFHAELKVYNAIDDRYPDDPINNSILHRSFGTLDGLQAFYPQDRTSTPFIPLEFLVDLRLEPWGFDRVVPRTTAKLRLDEFNRLRINKGGGRDEGGDEHFRSATDRIVVDCERFSASANPQHYAAIYNVITDLLLYTDPEQRSRSERLQNILLVHDWNDLGELADKVQDFQNKIRAREAVVHAYQGQVDELDGEARVQLYGVKAEIVMLASELGLLVECITMAGDKKRKQQSSGVQVDASARQIAWHMLDSEGAPIAKLAVLGVAFSWLSKKDSTVSNRLAIQDLQALNSSPEHVFSEIIAKCRGLQDHLMVKRDVFMTVLWNALAPIGGISIVDHLELHLHPIRLQIEHAVGRKIMDYVFSRGSGRDRARNGGNSKTTERQTGRNQPDRGREMGYPRRLLGGSHRPEPDSDDSYDDKQSIVSHRNGKRQRSPSSSVGGHLGEVLPVERDEDRLDVVEMRQRAKNNRTFVLVDVSPTTLALSYKCVDAYIELCFWKFGADRRAQGREAEQPI
jgi:hypothetical protein